MYKVPVKKYGAYSDPTKEDQFSTLKTLCINFLCKLKHRVAAEDENNIVYEMECSNCEAVYFS